MPRSQSPGITAAAALLLALTVGACTKSADDADSAAAGADAGQQVQATSGAAGRGCTAEKYNGGVPKLDLKTITVGFAQSEKEANPFRITETQSIKDEAAKRGIKLITTNAQSDLNKEIADIQGMIAQGAKALIISPLNSEGLDPALKAAQDAKVPIMTIDRLLTTKTACTDYIGWIGSDFVEQGERAADAMIKATGDTGRGRDPARRLRGQRHRRPHQGLQGPARGQGLQAEDRRRADRRLHPGEGPDGHRAADLGQPRTSPRSTPRTTRWRSARSRR